MRPLDLLVDVLRELLLLMPVTNEPPDVFDELEDTLVVSLPLLTELDLTALDPVDDLIPADPVPDVNLEEEPVFWEKTPLLLPELPVTEADEIW